MGNGSSSRFNAAMDPSNLSTTMRTLRSRLIETFGDSVSSSIPTASTIYLSHERSLSANQVWLLGLLGDPLGFMKIFHSSLLFVTCALVWSLGILKRKHPQFVKRRTTITTSASIDLRSGSEHVLSTAPATSSRRSDRASVFRRTISNEFLQSVAFQKDPDEAEATIQRDLMGSTEFDTWEQTNKQKNQRLLSNAGVAAPAMNRALVSLPTSPAGRPVTSRYWGPHVESLDYHTWTPPPSWTDAARRVFPKDVDTLQRTMKIDLVSSPPRLSISDQTAETGGVLAASPHQDVMKHHVFSLPVDEFSVHPKPPTESGTLEIYIKKTPKSEWMEHTFQSTHHAAQFQTDLIAAQLLGPAIQNMFQVLSLVHQGSAAHQGDEFVLHGNFTAENVDPTRKMEPTVSKGAAWNDIMRCFGSMFPRFRWQLEELWWDHTNHPMSPPGPSPGSAGTPGIPGTSNATGAGPEKGTVEGDGALLEKSPYDGKRLLLGPIDFFRLFVPLLPKDSIPYTSSNIRRMEQLLRWRKRVARASLLVQAFAKGRRIRNLGWNLPLSIPRENQLSQTSLTRRLAYDMNVDNQVRDRISKNEYYEASVLRDVHCQVRNANFYKSRRWWRWWSRDPPLRRESRSLSQAFTLVGTHMFDIKPAGSGTSDKNLGPLHELDPVQVIPSLRSMVEENPDVEFFLVGLYPSPFEVAVVSVYARILPRSIDSSFDCAWDRFTQGDKAYRDQRLELHVQLELGNQGLSPFVLSLILKLIAILVWLMDQSAYCAQSSLGVLDRYPLPPVQLAKLGRTYHFGGSKREGPRNYVACNCAVDSRSLSSFVSRIAITYIASGLLERDTVDVSFKIRATEEDELPERILCTARYVSLSLDSASLPYEAMGIEENRNASENVTRNSHRRKQNMFLLVIEYFFLDPFFGILRLLWRGVQWSQKNSSQSESTEPHSQLSSLAQQERATMIATSDPYGKAVNILIEILDEVRIPRRREQTVRRETSYRSQPRQAARLTLSESPSAGTTLQTRSDIEQVLLLSVLSRSDIYRYFVASGCSLKKAAVRLVESASWRGLTFPIDLRTCRVELQTGQFFQQGTDREGHPVFYFRNMCRGPWRADEDAVVGAVLHRLEKRLSEFTTHDPDVACTLVVIIGRPKKRKKRDYEKEETEEDDDDAEDEEESDEDEGDDSTEDGHPPTLCWDNPRVGSDEPYYEHSNERVVQRLVHLLLLHYPERLHRALVLLGGREASIPRTTVGATLALSQLIDSRITRKKVKFFKKQKDLQAFIEPAELIELVGGDAQINPKAFEMD